MEILLIEKFSVGMIMKRERGENQNLHGKRRRGGRNPRGGIRMSRPFFPPSSGLPFAQPLP